MTDPSMVDGGGGPAEEEGGSSTRAFLLTIVALYLFFGLLYLLQRPMARATRRCFGRRRASLDSHGASIRRSPSIVLVCRKSIFAIRTHIFNRMHPCGDGPSDESNYHSWTASQVSSWAYAKLQNHYREGGYGTQQLSGGYEDGEDAYEQQLAIQTAVIALQRQHIDGNALVHLTLDRLIRFGIPFGVAVRLMACIQELVPHRLASGVDKADALLPAWYERNEAVNDNDEVHVDEKELEMAEQAERVMKERFGMRLPTLRGGDASGEASNGNDPRSGASHPTSLPTGQQAAFDDVISSMPLEVRAVAERRPDLVAQLMSQSQNHYSPAALQTVSEEMDVQSDEEVGVDPESVGLLRRRANK